MGRTTIYSWGYGSLFSDGTIGCSDGVGFLDEMSRDEVRELYQALKTVFDVQPRNHGSIEP